jgi:rubrerythrin
MAKKSETTRHRENWQNEIDSAFLYRALASVEPQPALAEVYRKLAATEEAHAQFWEQKLLQAGQPIPRLKIGWRTRVLV